MSGAREVALDVIFRVAEEGAYSSLVLPAALRRANLDARDRDLVTELTYGTLRRLRRLDDAIGRFSDRPVDRMTPHARALLRLGAYQILDMRIPAHAAVSETVELAEGRERGFVNAVLRKVSADRPALPSGPGDDAIGVRTGMSTWAVRELRLLLGDETEEAAAAFAQRPPLCVRANACAQSPDELERAFRDSGLEPRRGSIASDCVLVEGAVVERLPGYAQGWFAVQDQASAFVATALGAQPGERVLDLCAGPGGKAGAIACAVGIEGALVAADAAPKRARLVRTGLDRLQLPGAVLAQDARHPALRPGRFDRVLVDAPCSGIGSARRRPELLWRPDRARLSQLARLQVEIAGAAADLLKPGGMLLYSVCTFPRAETDAVCDALARRHPELQPQAIEGPDGPSARIRLWPHRDGTDGMFLAAFRKGEVPGASGGKA
ncbi:MAG: 16S rRNA (cytosine(967)-C(5))-methyltransferase RsmB [Actinomycetota bacterium]